MTNNMNKDKIELLKKKLKKIIDMFFVSGFQTVYKGNIFDRFQGLEDLFKNCKGSTVLDIGSAEGLIDYELAKNGASTIHGFERDRKRVQFSKLLFQEVPVESEFHVADLSITHQAFDTKFRKILLNQYDIVLYLGVYHHLIKQASSESVHDFIRYLLGKTTKLFVVRTDLIPSFENIILEEGFHIYSEAPVVDAVGPLKIYKRN